MKIQYFLAFAAFLAVFAGLSPASAQRDIVAGPVRGEVLRVLDGDTVAVRLHVWIGQDIETHVRIAGIDAPEIKGKCGRERAEAQAAKSEMTALVEGKQISLYNIQLEKYAGRVMAEAVTSDGTNIGKDMLNKGLARPYHGEKRQPWCTATEQARND